MKKLIFFCLLLPQILFAQKIEKYCKVIISYNDWKSTPKVKIESIDYGNGNIKKGFEEVSQDKFKTDVDILNYMETKNWHFVSREGYSFYFMQDYDPSDSTSRIGN